MWPFTPSWIKKTRELEKNGRRFLNYKRDQLRPETVDKIESCLRGLEAGRREKNPKKAEEKTRELELVVSAVGPAGATSAIRENVEVIFVAIVIALSIKSFVVQPFMIPTGSMQPTLNGVKMSEIAFEDADWNPVEKLGQRLLAGRTLIDQVLEQPKTLVGMKEVTRFRFFTSTILFFDDNSSISVALPMRALMEDFGLEERLELEAQRQGIAATGRKLVDGSRLAQQLALPEGFVLAQGVKSLGDQVLVNRIAYHFRAPKRGEVFVFTTKDIAGLRQDYVNAGLDGQHYIKRLVGVPGDRLQILSGDYNLWVNGERGMDPGIARMGRHEMTAEGRYTGYLLPREGGDLRAFPEWPVKKESVGKGESQLIEVGDQQYVAMGDNSASSLDSRYWGVVPERNLVGPALFSYWPFHTHWGLID